MHLSTLDLAASYPNLCQTNNQLVNKAIVQNWGIGSYRGKMKSKRQIAIFALFLSILISAIGLYFVKKAVGHLHPANLMFWRYLIATSILCCFGFRKFKKSSWKPGILLGALLFGTIFFQYVGLETMPASTTGFVMGLAVVLVPLFARSFTSRTWMAVGVAALGIAIISLYPGFSIGFDWILLAAVCFSLYILLVGNYTNAHNLLTLIMLQCLFVCLLSGVIAYCQDSLTLLNELSIWINTLVLAIFNSLISIWLQFYAQRHLSHTTTAIIVSCEPILATIVAVVLLSEQLKWNFYLGSILLFTAILISEIRLNKPRAPEC